METASPFSDSVSASDIGSIIYSTSNIVSPIKFLVVGAQRGALLPSPDDYLVHDAQEAFDAVLVIEGTADELGDLLTGCSNPLAPVICGPDATLPHCDAALAELTFGTLMEAAAKVRPIVKAIADLPKLPLGVHRPGLIALGLASTRNLNIQASWAPDRPEMVSYPLLWRLKELRPVLEELADAKLARRDFFDCVQFCPRCQSSRLVAREICPSCSSSHLVESPLIHHYRCSHQGPETGFHRDQSGLICPKCDRTLRHYGVDYDKPGTIFTCAACSATASDPAVSFVCVDCRADSRGEVVGKRDWYSYSLMPDAVSALRAGNLPHRDFSRAGTSQNISRAVRDFRLLVEQMVPIAKRYGRPLTVWKLELGLDAIIAAVGPERTGKVCEFVREIVVQGLRASDFTAPTPDGIVACLPETSREGAHVIIDAVRRHVADTVSVPLDLKFSVFEVGDIDRFIDALP